MQNVEGFSTLHPRYNSSYLAADVSTEYVTVGVNPEKVNDAVTKVDGDTIDCEEYNPHESNIKQPDDPQPVIGVRKVYSLEIKYLLLEP